MSNYFITATGTDIGKTLVTTSLAHQLQAQGKKVAAIKPVISGFNTEGSDSANILLALGREASPDAIAAISPWRLVAPLSPHDAAQREGRHLAVSELVAFCQSHIADIVLVEGAGGVMTPLSMQETMLDWMAALSYPVILVTGSYLGAISHTLTAYKVLQQRGLSVQAIVVSESKETVVLDDMKATLRGYVGEEVRIALLPRLAGAGDLWKYAPDITRII